MKKFILTKVLIKSLPKKSYISACELCICYNFHKDCCTKSSFSSSECKISKDYVFVYKKSLKYKLSKL